MFGAVLHLFNLRLVRPSRNTTPLHNSKNIAMDIAVGVVGLGLGLERIHTTSVSVPRANTSCADLSWCESGADTTRLQAARGLSCYEKQAACDSSQQHPFRMFDKHATYTSSCSMTKTTTCASGRCSTCNVNVHQCAGVHGCMPFTNVTTFRRR
jgi:hypothetical protein